MFVISLQDIYTARDELTRFMNEQVAERKAALSGFSDASKELRRDAFSMLVAANEAESEKRKLTDDEVVGNVFAMLFAGHGWYNPSRLSQNRACDELELWQRRLDMPWLRLWDACLFTKISKTALFSKSKKLLGIIVTP